MAKIRTQDMPNLSAEEWDYHTQSLSTTDAILDHLDRLGEWSRRFEEEFHEDERAEYLQSSGQA
ncbi:hypothetical protein HK102_001313, partial [Quaeritorhiza haematococci]